MNIFIPVFLTFKHISKRSHVSWFEKNFIIEFFIDTVWAKFYRLCIIITMLWVYQFIPDLTMLTLFQGHRCLRVTFLRFLSSVVSLVYCSWIHRKDQVQYALCDWCVFNLKRHNEHDFFFIFAQECELSEHLLFLIFFCFVFLIFCLLSLYWIEKGV